VVPLTDWAVGRLGIVRVWRLALLVFAAGAVLSGLAWSLPALIAARAVQGLGAGLLLPVGQTLVMGAAPPEGRGGALGRASAPLLVGPVAGPLVGGALVAQFGWRWVFLGMIPFAMLALWASRNLRPGPNGRSARTFDLAGALLLVGGLTLIVFGVARSQQGSTAGLVAACVVAGLVLAILFGLRATGSPDRSLVDVRGLAQRTFGSAVGIALLFNLVHWGAFPVLVLLFRDQGATVVEAGLWIAPQGLGSLAAVLVSGRMADRRGGAPVAVTGAALALAATATCALATSAPAPLLSLVLVVRGFGMSSLMMGAYASAYGAVEDSHMTNASTVLNVASRIGGSLGVALLLAVLHVSGFTASLLVAAALLALAGALAGRLPWSPGGVHIERPFA
jgi:EmrB/QacA subfamily drug resistance transporter